MEFSLPRRGRSVQLIPNETEPSFLELLIYEIMISESKKKARYSKKDQKMKQKQFRNMIVGEKVASQQIKNRIKEKTKLFTSSQTPKSIE